MSNLQVCGYCARPTRKDLSKGWCPATAWCISPAKDATQCRMFVDRDTVPQAPEKRKRQRRSANVRAK